jgi:hypothetical protein
LALCTCNDTLGDILQWMRDLRLCTMVCEGESRCHSDATESSQRAAAHFCRFASRRRGSFPRVAPTRQLSASRDSPPPCNVIIYTSYICGRAVLVFDLLAPIYIRYSYLYSTRPDIGHTTRFRAIVRETWPRVFGVFLKLLLPQYLAGPAW